MTRMLGSRDVVAAARDAKTLRRLRTSNDQLMLDYIVGDSSGDLLGSHADYGGPNTVQHNSGQELFYFKGLERAMGIKPTTYSLGRSLA